MIRPTIAALLLAPCAFSQFAYDFNNLTGSDTHPYTMLDGQDGWSEETFNARNRCGVTATLSHDGTPSLRFQEVGPGYGCDASRLRDGSWGFAFNGTETDAYFMADVQVGFWGGSFGMAYDFNGDSRIRGSQAGERGVRFTIGSQANAQLQLNAADGTRVRVPLAGLAAGGNWVRIRVAMDFTAASGAGLGWLELQNITNGDTRFTPVPGLQGVPLGLDPTGSDATNPALWDAVWLHFEGATYGLDNIEVGAGLARSEEYGTGCGNPALGLRGLDRAVIGATASVETYDIPSNSTVGFTLFGVVRIDPGLDLSAIGMPGCLVQVASEGALAFATTGPTAVTSLPVPNDPTLRGASIYLQAVTTAPGANRLGLITSNGVRWVLGVR